MRVLHAAYSLGIGGIESWLIELLRQIRRQGKRGVTFDFYLSEPGGCFEEEARSYGCTIYYAPKLTKVQKGLELFGLYHPYGGLEALLKKERYDVFHTHSVHSGGLQARAAARACVPVRVVHCHCSRYNENDRPPAGFKGKMRYRRFLRENIPEILRYATAITPCSSNAARFLLGDNWRDYPQCRVIFCGMSTERYRNITCKRAEVRARYGFSDENLVVGNAGRMGSLLKNQPLLIDIFGELYRRNPRCRLFLAGDGTLRPQFMQHAKEKGLESVVLFPGYCDSAPLMTSCFDLFALPSLAGEGLPVVGMEATAGGLFTVCSDVITPDFTETFPDRVRTVSLRAPLAEWADALEEGFAKKLTLEEGCRLLEASPFSIRSSLEALLDVYQTAR